MSLISVSSTSTKNLIPPVLDLPPAKVGSRRARMGGKEARWVNLSELDGSLAGPRGSKELNEDRFELGSARGAATASPSAPVRNENAVASAELPGGILFDNDGVLVDASVAWFKTLQDASDFFGFKPVTWEQYENYHNLSLSDTVEGLGLPCDKKEVCRYLYANVCRYLSDVRVNADARPLLEELKGRGVKLAVTSNKDSPAVRAILGGAGLLPYFDAVIGRDQVARNKPSPDMLFRACCELGIHPSETWMVGDAPKDQVASRKAGVRFFGLGVDGGERIESLGEIQLRIHQRP